MKHRHPPTIIALTGVFLFTAGTTLAQQAPQPTYKLGDIGLTPTVSATITQTDNIRQNPAAVSDYRSDIMLEMMTTLVNSDNAKLSVDPLIMVRSYRNYSSDNRTLTSVTASGEYKLTKEWNVSSNLRRFDADVSQSDPNAIPGAVRAMSTTNLGNFQLNYVSPTYYDNVVLNVQKLTFSASFLPQSNTTVYNSDQNRSQVDVDNHFGRKFEWLDLNIYSFLGVNKIDYESSVSANVNGRNSTGQKIGFGVSITPAPSFTGTALYGFIRQKYDDPALGTQEGLWANVSATWRPNPANQAALNFSRSFNETIIPGATGYFLNTLSIQGQHFYSPEWSVDVAPSFTNAEVANYPATLKQHMVTLGLNRTFAGGMSLRAAFMTSSQDVNNEDFSSFRYKERAFSLTLSTKL